MYDCIIENISDTKFSNDQLQSLSLLRNKIDISINNYLNNKISFIINYSLDLR